MSRNREDKKKRYEKIGYLGEGQVFLTNTTLAFFDLRQIIPLFFVLVCYCLQGKRYCQ